MKRSAIVFCTALVLLCAGFSLTADDTASKGDTTTMVGEYHWNDRASGELKAIFTPAGDGQWTVDFHFDFRDEPHIYSGTAEGSLSEGGLKGTVKNENKKRTFIFKGAFEDGQFSGDHEETTEGRERRTGTMTLGPM